MMSLPSVALASLQRSSQTSISIAVQRVSATTPRLSPVSWHRFRTTDAQEVEVALRYSGKVLDSKVKFGMVYGAQHA